MPSLRVTLRMRVERMRSRREAGAAAVEAVLVTPLFLLLIFGVVETGVAVMNWNAVHGAAREGARAASVNGSADRADFSVLTEVKERMRTATGDVRYVIVFKASNVQSDPPTACVVSAQSGGNGVADLCNVYYTADLARPSSDFSQGGATQADVKWPAYKRVDWMNGPVDLVGVHVVMNHYGFTGIIPKSNIGYTTVFAIEAATEDGE